MFNNGPLAGSKSALVLREHRIRIDDCGNAGGPELPGTLQAVPLTRKNIGRADE